jgi:hypothetical protein
VRARPDGWRALSVVLLLVGLGVPGADRLAGLGVPGADRLGVTAAAAQGTAADGDPMGPPERRPAGDRRRGARALRRPDRRDRDEPDRVDDSDFDPPLLGLSGVAWRVLLVLAVIVAVVVAVQLSRRGPPRRRRRRRAVRETAEDVAAVVDGLEQQARAAERDGEHRIAVALWFAAGTRRLAASTPVRGDGTATSGQVARHSGDERVGVLAVAHDRAVYGPGPVGPEDSRAAREGWTAVLDGPSAKAGVPS